MNLLKYLGYYILRENGNEADNDPRYFGRVHGLSDCVLVEGGTMEEFEEGFITAVSDYFETCRQLRKLPDAPVQFPVPEYNYTIKILG